ncbi:MAG: TetR/AcrR family transcriptional regulator [Clostridia bacterium]|nr:TetR/AcrR family transcriptional regulator [Clostridia bacterium]
MKKDETENKENRLLNTAFKLFTEKGIKNTSIQDIVDNAEVGKGTFYLYFKDKYEIRDILIEKKSQKLFHDALNALRKTNIKDLTDQVIFIIDYIIDELKKKPLLLSFISKNLSWGIYTKTVQKLYDNQDIEEDSIFSLFQKGIKDNNIQLKNPEVTLFMIIELVSSTCFSSISYEQPLPIDEYKEYLFDTIRKLINN